MKNPNYPREISMDVLDRYLDGTYHDYISQISNSLDNREQETISYYNNLLEKYWWFRVIRKEQGVYTIEFVR